MLVGTFSIGIVLPVTVASATPSPADLQAQIEAKQNSLEQIVEQYDKVTEELKATQAAQAALATQLAPLQAGMDSAYSAVQDVVVKAYEGAPLGTGAALLEAGSPADLIDQLGALDQIGRQHRTVISGYEQAKSKYDGQKQQLDAAQAAQTAEQQQLDAQKTKINSDGITANAEIAIMRGQFVRLVLSAVNRPIPTTIVRIESARGHARTNPRAMSRPELEQLLDRRSHVWTPSHLQ